MGRYWQCAKFSGKFGFGIQSSDDPEKVFGMQEEDPSYINYYAEREDSEKFVKEALDKQFDIIGVPQKERFYTVKNEEELNKLCDGLSKYCFEAELREEAGSVIGYGGGEEWENQFKPEGVSSEDFKKKYIIKEVGQRHLAACRVRLGVAILSELKENGYCSLEAEI